MYWIKDTVIMDIDNRKNRIKYACYSIYLSYSYYGRPGDQTFGAITEASSIGDR